MTTYKFGFITPEKDAVEIFSINFNTLEEVKTTVDRLKGRNPTWIFKLYKYNPGRKLQEIKEK